MSKYNLSLRPYQKEDALFLAHLKAGACFNEQRTGKTPTSLRALAAKKCKKIIIVCPPSCVIPWASEYNKWLEKPCIACVGTHAKQQQLIKTWTDGLVVSYDSLKATARSEGLVKDILKQHPDAIIIDEAHKIKDPKSHVAKSIFKLSGIQHKIALTATPAPNYPHEIWSILHFLFPKTFTSYWKFLEDYFVIEEHYLANRTFKKVGRFKPGKQKLLQLFLNSISTQRKRKDVFDWLPEKDYQQIYLEPSKQQEEQLYELTRYYEIADTDIICQNTLDRLIRYRQVCAAPEILNLPGKSPKLEWLYDYLKDYPEKHIIIFTKFKSLINIIKQKLPDIQIITGDINLKERENIRQKFQNKEFNVLLAQIDTCKEGLTLDIADTIIFLDKYPPVSDILQAEDRFIATTKERSNKDHLIIELILKGTYDEELYALIKDHASEIDVINNFKKYLN